ncbi:MAG: GntR family transcriptional regulator [Thermoleophilia bacterium]
MHESPARKAPVENVTLWGVCTSTCARRSWPTASPGHRACGGGLASSLGVSRGPLREALGRLAAEGLVTIRPRRGAVVSALSHEEFLQAYQVREALETLAIRLAVPNLDEATLDAIDELVDQQALTVEGEQVDRFFELNSRLHQLFVDASGNATLQDMHGQLMAHMGRYQMRSLALRGTLRRSVSEHRAIARACRARDPERAERLLRQHIRVPQRRLESASHEEVVLKR